MKNRHFSWFLILITSLLFFNCQSQSNEKMNITAGADEDYVVTISTKHGDMKVVLFDETPQHKANFINLVKKGFYDSLLFHRVIQTFMAQGGDPTSKGAKPFQSLGAGDPGYKVPAEIPSGTDKKLFHKKGALAAARQGDQVNPKKESNGSQFYIVQGKTYSTQELEGMKVDYKKMNELFPKLLNMPEHLNLRNEVVAFQTANDRQGLNKLFQNSKNLMETTFGVELDLAPFSKEQMTAYSTIGGTPMLDGEYTVFGQVVEGLEVVDKICAQPVGAADRPKEDIMMKMSLEVMKKSKITEKYGKMLQ
jgi:cyclophilin family peptidyl-prolyl cis-trans isomerase